VLAYLSRYTHRVAISNRRLISADETGVTFKCKDYRIEGPGRYKTMTLPTHEFIRRFLIHVLPKGVHHIRHSGCSPATAPPTSRGCASCSMPLHLRSNLTTQRPTSPMNYQNSRMRARAAAAA